MSNIFFQEITKKLKITVDFINQMVYNNNRKEVINMGKSKEEALRNLLKLIADYPDLADRITITIKPSKVKQGDTED